MPFDGLRVRLRQAPSGTGLCIGIECLMARFIVRFRFRQGFQSLALSPRRVLSLFRWQPDGEPARSPHPSPPPCKRSQGRESAFSCSGAGGCYVSLSPVDMCGPRVGNHGIHSSRVGGTLVIEALGPIWGRGLYRWIVECLLHKKRFDLKANLFQVVIWITDER